MKALILVDIQNDFLPGGALGVPEGDKIIPEVNQLLQKNFDVIVATKDWHPKDHGSFASVHHKQPGEKIDLYGLEQILWPEHCVQGTRGSEFGSGWDTDKIEKIFYKGTDKTIDSYSTFFDNGHRKSTGLEQYLKDKGVNDIYIAGLTTEYCVAYSALDARKLGFNVFVVVDACKPVNLQKDDEQRALNQIRAAGGHLIRSESIPF